MKSFWGLFLFIAFAAHVRGNLNDLDHDDHHHHHHDHHHDHDDDHSSNLAKELLFEIEKFLPGLPDEEIETFVVPSLNEPIDTGSGSANQLGGVPLSLPVNEPIDTGSVSANKLGGVPLSLPVNEPIDTSSVSANQLGGVSLSLPVNEPIDTDSVSENQLGGVPLSLPVNEPIDTSSVSANQLGGVSLSLPVNEPIDTDSVSENQLGGVPLSLPVNEPIDTSSVSANQLGGVSLSLPVNEPIDTGSVSANQIGEVPLSLPVNEPIDTNSVSANQLGGVPLFLPVNEPIDTGSVSADQLGGVPFSLPVNKPVSTGTVFENEIEGNALTPPVNSFNNRLSKTQGLPRAPKITDNALHQPQPSRGSVPKSPISTNLVINRPDSIEAFDSREELSPIARKVHVPNSLSSASFSLDSAHDDYDDINDNFIGGRGRQLDAGQPPHAPNSFSPFDGDYPRFEVVPETSFSCSDKPLDGYYADTEAECQVFHVCLHHGLVGSFVCPVATLFNQAHFVCDWWFNVDCSLAPQNYQLNARIGVVPDRDEDFS